MKKPKRQSARTGGPPGNHNGNGALKWRDGGPPRPGDPKVPRPDQFIEQVRRIIADAPEVRPEKVEPLQEAIASGTYEIDARKVANALITKIILDS
jgi:flagellar biosynthesis anti-sigma factor FlgM